MQELEVLEACGSGMGDLTTLDPDFWTQLFNPRPLNLCQSRYKTIDTRKDGIKFTNQLLNNAANSGT